MKWVLLIVAVVVGLALVTALALPATTRTTVEIRFDAPIEAVWAVYTDFESQPNWRSDVAKVEAVSPPDCAPPLTPEEQSASQPAVSHCSKTAASDYTSWTETLKPSGMRVHFQVLEASAPNRLVLKTGSEGSFEGRYVAEFRAENGGTLGTFTEEATALGVVPKVLRRLFFDQRKFIEAYAEEAKAEISRRQSAAGG